MNKQHSNFLMVLFSLFLVVIFFPKHSFAGSKIDQGDSIVFDLSKAIIKNGLVEIPIYVASDNDINALDFSLKFNQPKLTYNKIIDNTGYIEDLAFYSSTTKFLKFTSNSFTNYEKNKNILTLRFSSDSLTINKNDFFELAGYLNGDVCNIVFLDSLDKSKIPALIRTPNNFKEHLSCGSEHSLALKTNGQVWAWGNNVYGQLGNNSINSSNVPVPVRGVSNNSFLNNAIAVAAGANHSLALLCDGTIAAWGANNAGQLGNGTTDSSLYPVIVKGLPADIPVFSIAAGNMHSLVLLADGSLWAWGDNSFGQLGNNTVDNASLPVKVAGIDGAGFLSNAINIAAGDFHNLILLNNGKVLAFGNNEKGQLGNGNVGGILLTPAEVLFYDKVDTVKKVVDLDAGKNHSLVLLSNGSILSWGDNSSGQLGDSSFTDSSEPIVVKGISGVELIAAGDNFNLVVLEDATSWAWGDNAKGQLGDNSIGLNKSIPVQMHGIGSADVFIGGIAIAAGKEFSAAIIDQGTGGLFIAAGDNSFGQLGDSTLISKSYFTSVSSLFNMELPVVSFTPENGKTICSSASVTFESSVNSQINTNYYWEFGLGSIPQNSTAANPNAVKYTTPGEKIVKLVVSQVGVCNETWSDTLIQIINIIPSADATFSSSSPGCQGQGINFYNAGSSGLGIKHLWKLGYNNLTSELENLTDIKYPEPGAFAVSHTVVISDCAIIDTKTLTITVHPTPLVSVDYSGNACVNDSIGFVSSGSSGEGTSYIWEFGAGASITTSNVQDPKQIYYKTSGFKNVNLFVKNQFGCFNSIQKTLEIKSTPQADFESSAFVSLCSGEPIDFLHTGDSTAIIYNWKFGEGSSPDTSNLRNPAGIIYSTNGLKTVKLNLTNDITKCSVSSEKIFTVNQTPTASFNLPESDCAEKSLVLSNTSFDDQASVYSWDFGLGAIPPYSTSKIPEPIHYVSAGNKVVRLTIKNSIGCSSTSVQNYNVKALPNIANVGSDISICRNEARKIGDLPMDGKNYYWSPAVGLDNQNIANPTAKPDSTITYFLTVSDSFCEARVDSIVVIVNPLPEANAGMNDSLFRGESVQLNASGGSLYQWSPSIGLSNSSDPNTFAKPEATTKYNLLVTDNNGCKDTNSVVVFVKIPNEDRVPNTFVPGGFGNDKFYINIEGAEVFEFVVFNNWGKSIFYTKDMTSGWDGKNQVTGDDMPQGAYVYFVNAVKKDGTPVYKQGLINLIR